MLKCAFNKVAYTTAWVLNICSERLMYVRFTFCFWGKFDSESKSKAFVRIVVLRIQAILASMCTLKFFTENADYPTFIY